MAALFFVILCVYYAAGKSDPLGVPFRGPEVIYMLWAYYSLGVSFFASIMLPGEVVLWAYHSLGQKIYALGLLFFGRIIRWARCVSFGLLFYYFLAFVSCEFGVFMLPVGGFLP